MKSVCIPLVILAASAAMICVAGDTGKDKKYEYVQIQRFELEPGVDLPADYQIAMVEDIAKQFEGTKKVKRVLRQGEAVPDGAAALRVTGVVTKYSKGSQATRYLVGFGAGATVVAAQVKFTDTATDEVLLDKKMDGKVVMGLMGGKSTGATNGLAKEIVKAAKGKFL